MIQISIYYDLLKIDLINRLSTLRGPQKALPNEYLCTLEKLFQVNKLFQKEHLTFFSQSSLSGEKIIVLNE